MINCPSCAKEIADDSAHCGYCGHQIEQKEKKKTMFGMAALGGEDLKKAVEDAKKAKEESAGSSGGKSSPGSGLKIPKPGSSKKGGSSQAGKASGSSKPFTIPKPGNKADKKSEPDREGAYAKTELLDLPDKDEPGLQEPSEQPTAGQPKVAGPQHELTPSDGGAQEPNASTQPVDLSSNSVDDPGGPDTGLTLGEPPGPGEAGRGGPVVFGGDEGSDIDDVSPTDPSATSQPTGPGSGPAPGPAAGPGAANTGLQGPQNNALEQTEEKKSKKGLIIAVVGVALLLGMGCMGGIAYGVASYFDLL
ncbi:MAG: hypothetical protein ACOC9W_01770 [Persicimonas sp.]